MKNLIVFLDGTLDTAMVANADRRMSNVYKINIALDADDKDGRNQIAFYSSGIGAQSRLNSTSGRKRNVPDSILGYVLGATGEGICRQVWESYINLCANYEPGDKLFIFGFSRGAAAAKVLCNLIDRFQLLRADKIDKFSEMWNRFKIDLKKDESKWISLYCHKKVNIDFLGMFDCVPGYLSTRQNAIARYAYENTIPVAVKKCVHILSIDEERKSFSPVIYKDRVDKSLTQIWIPGGHGDVGGTVFDSISGDCSLLTMIWHIRNDTSLSIRRDTIRIHLRMLINQSNDSPQINYPGNPLWLMLGKSRRIISESRSTFVHPLFYHVYGTTVRISRGSRRYIEEYSGSYRMKINDIKMHPAHNRIWSTIAKSLFSTDDRIEVQRHVPGPGECLARM